MALRICIVLTMFFAFVACAESKNAAERPAELSKAVALAQAIEEEHFKNITSVLVSVGKETRYENYWGEGGPSHMNDTRSAMKTLIAMAVGAAIQDGHIESVSASAFGWFDSEKPFRFSSPLKSSISLLDLLTMSSALDCNDNVWESPGNEEHMYPARNWTYFVVDLPTRADYERDAAGYGSFAYCTAGSFLLGQVVERAASKPVDEYIQDRLLEPLGISQAVWDKSPSGEIMTGGGAEMTSRDLLKLGQLLLNAGRFQDEQVLSPEWVASMLSVHRNANETQDYGLQIWREDFRCGNGTVAVWYMGGNGGNKIAIFPELETVAVVTATLYGTRGMHQQSTDILEKYILPSLAACAD